MAEAAGSTIMIVGVDSDFTYLMQYYARKSGHQALVSSPDNEALNTVRRVKPALIVLEADRADAAGWDLLQTLKVDECTSHIPVLVCSWLDEEASGMADCAACYRTGCDRDRTCMEALGSERIQPVLEAYL